MDGEHVSAAATQAHPERTPLADTPTRGPLLLQLQRRIGNRAVGRLLQREELEVTPMVEDTLVLGEEEGAQPLADAAGKARETDQKAISTPLPTDAAKAGSSYTVTRGGAQVEIKKDASGGKSTYTSWTYDFAKRPKFTTSEGSVASVTTPEVKTTIQTTYEKGVTGSEESAYGRGTTQDDQKNGTISLRFHEACHGKDYLAYMAAHPVPTLSLSVGDPADGAQAAVDAYIKAVSDWHNTGLTESETNTDAVGTPGQHTH